MMLPKSPRCDGSEPDEVRTEFHRQEGEFNLAQLDSEMPILAERLKRYWMDNHVVNPFSRDVWTDWGMIVKGRMEPQGFVYGDDLPKNDTAQTLEEVEKLLRGEELRTEERDIVFVSSAAASFASGRAKPENRIEAKRGAIVEFVKARLKGDALFLLILTTVTENSGLVEHKPGTSSLLYGTVISSKRVSILQPWAFGSDLPEPNPRAVPSWH
jgi:hypothetical protein